MQGVTCESQLVLSSIPNGVTGLTLVQLLISHQVRPWISQVRLQGAPRPLWQCLHAHTAFCAYHIAFRAYHTALRAYYTALGAYYIAFRAYHTD